MIHDENHPRGTKDRGSSAQLRDEQIAQPGEKDGPIRISVPLRINNHLRTSRAYQGEITIISFSGYNDERMKERSIGAYTSDKSDAFPVHGAEK
jgi:hypothetical protein